MSKIHHHLHHQHQLVLQNPVNSNLQIEELSSGKILEEIDCTDQIKSALVQYNFREKITPFELLEMVNIHMDDKNKELINTLFDPAMKNTWVKLDREFISKYLVSSNNRNAITNFYNRVLLDTKNDHKHPFINSY